MLKFRVLLVSVCLLGMSGLAVSELCSDLWKDPQTGDDLCYYATIRDNNKLETAAGELGSDAPLLCDCVCPGYINGADTYLMNVAAEHESVQWIYDMLTPPMNCNPDTLDPSGNSALHTSASFCTTSSASVLLRGVTTASGEVIKADPDQFNAEGDTALCIVATKTGSNCPGIVQYLHQYNAEMRLKCNDLTPCEITDLLHNYQIRYWINEYDGCLTD